MGDGRFHNTVFFRRENVDFFIPDYIFEPALFDLNQSPYAVLGRVVLQKARWHGVLCKRIRALIGDDVVRKFLHDISLFIKIGSVAYVHSRSFAIFVAIERPVHGI